MVPIWGLSIIQPPIMRLLAEVTCPRASQSLGVTEVLPHYHPFQEPKVLTTSVMDCALCAKWVTLAHHWATCF